MFIKSIRWRLQLWLAFLIACVLSGFGVTAYQLQRNNQISQIDEELEQRVTALDQAVRGGPPPDSGPGHHDGEGGPGWPDFDDGARRPPPSRGRPDGPPPDRGREMRPGQRDIRISSEMAVLFDEARSNAFYFTIWSRDGTQLKRSTNAPPDVPLPERLARDTRTHTRRRDAYRESYHFTELEDCVLAGRTLSVHFSAMRRFTFWLLAAGGTVLVFGLGGGWWLTTRAIRPVEEISAAASRISAGNLSERISEAHADNELGRLAGVLNSTFAQDRGIQIHCHLAPAEAFINAGHLGLILTNLLTNAIHYNKPKGEIRVSTRLENGAAVLTVADSGIGISAENLPHVFERFYRADKSRSRAEGHSGLGLAICQAMVEAHDGSIDASSQLGVGTTFTVRRPDAPSL